MKTLEKITFPKLENEFLENILRQLVNQHAIIQLFFTKQIHCSFSYLIIHIEKDSDAKILQEQKWLRKVRNRYQIDAHFICSTKLNDQFSLGHPFVELYCQPSALIYQREDLKDRLIVTRNWKKYKKRFNAFQEHFYNDHNLYHLQIQNLITEDSSNSVFTSYSRLIEYDLEYLEELYLGRALKSLSLEERINNLTAHIPDIQKYFVKTSPNSYYLTELFEKAKEATVDDIAIYRNEMYEAVGITEKNLFNLVKQRFEELKKHMKKGDVEKNKVSYQVDIKPKDKPLDIAIQIIVNLVEVEQIYLYHQITYGEKTTYLLMLIANGGTNEKLRSIIHFLKSKMAKNYDFVLISHSRKWIQENLYHYQSFFVNIIQSKYLIYSSSKYLPEIHWETPHKPYHADLYFYYKPTKDIAVQFFTIANNPKNNFQGLEYLFSLFFLSFCRTFIFIKTYYLPNDLTSQALWHLCSYADPEIRKYNYLFEQFGANCFAYLNEYRVLHHKLSKLKKEEVHEMNTIVEKLMFHLDDLINKDGHRLSVEED